MSNLSVNIKGLKELGQAMNSLERKVRNSIGVKAMRKGGAVIRNQARANAPVLEHSVSPVSYTHLDVYKRQFPR